MIKTYIDKIIDNGKQEDMEELSEILEDSIKNSNKSTTYINILKEMSEKEDKKMNNMRNYDDSEYHGGEYRENYRNDRDYREDYREDYRNDYRTRDYDRRGGKINRRNYRNYREEEIYDELENAMYEAKECHRKMEDLAEMTNNTQMKNTLMKIALREKEHYTSLKELLEK